MRFFYPSANSRGSGNARISAVDVLVYAFILSVGAFQFTHYTRSADFLIDPTYPDLARSILEQGSYQLRFLPQTTFPPGFPLVLALAAFLAGFTPMVLYGVVAVSTTLGLMASYQLLRSVEGRGVATGACLLLACSPALFSFNTVAVFPEMTYFLVSTLALLLTLKIDRNGRGSALIIWIPLLAVALALALLIRSVGVALLMGMVTWISISVIVLPKMGRRRIKRFLIPVALGLTAQLCWSVWAHRHETLEWQLPGYPQSYISQLRVKNGHYPELGMAHLTDIPSRVRRNIIARAVGFDQLLTRRYFSNFWSSPAILGVLILIAVGLAFSFRNGGQLHDWYFLCYEFIFSAWPWDYRDRFLFPVVPLACLYLWRGAKVLKTYSLCQPRRAGMCFGVVGLFLCLSSAAFAFRITTFTLNIQHAKADRLQPFASTVFWGILGVVGFGIFLFHSPRGSQDHVKGFACFSWIRGPWAQLPLRFIAALTVAVLVLSGTRQVIARGRENLKTDITKQTTFPEIEAAEWIRKNEPPERVLMAREPDLIFHFTHRRAVWLPPISDPKVLMEGIWRHHVGVIVVVHRIDSYWLPPEDVCFQSLLQAYPNMFHLVHRGPDNQVFEVQGLPEVRWDSSHQ